MLIALPIGSYYLVYKYLSERTNSEDDINPIQTNDKSRRGMKIIENIKYKTYNLAEEASKWTRFNHHRLLKESSMLLWSMALRRLQLQFAPTLQSYCSHRTKIPNLQI